MPGYVKQITTYEENTGEVVSDVVTKGSTNGNGWVIMYTEKIEKLVMSCTSAATLRVFMLLAAGQQYEERGMVTTKKAIQEKLGIDKKTCITAFNWLKENLIINEYRVNGVTEFMVNPELVTVGRDKRKRQKEWLRRWAGQTVGTGSIGLPKSDKLESKKVPKLLRTSTIVKGRSISSD